VTADLSRRRLLALGATAAGGAVALGSAQLAGATRVGATAKRPSLAHWHALVGSTVHFHTHTGRQVALKVREAAALRHDKLLTGSGYALLLVGARHPLLSDAPGVLHHPSFGTQSARLLPVGKPGSRQAYQFIVDGRRPVASARR
jgi:hypothetical protein